MYDILGALKALFEEVHYMDFYRDIFPEGSFEERGEYEDGKYNGIAIAIEKGSKRAKRMTITDDLDTIADMAIKGNQEDLENDEVIPALRAEIQELDKSISNLLKLVEKGAESETLAARLTDLEKRKRDVERRLVVAEDDYIILDKPLIVRWLSQFLNGDIEDEDFRRQIIDLLVNSVTVWDEPDGYYKITSVYNLMEEEVKSFRVKADGCSDLRSQLPP